MHAFEIIKPDASSATLNASGYTWDHRAGSIAFYDCAGNRVAGYDKGEWLTLHIRSPPLKADRIGLAPTTIIAVEG